MQASPGAGHSPDNRILTRLEIAATGLMVALYLVIAVGLIALVEPLKLAALGVALAFVALSASLLLAARRRHWPTYVVVCVLVPCATISFVVVNSLFFGESMSTF